MVIISSYIYTYTLHSPRWPHYTQLSHYLTPSLQYTRNQKHVHICTKQNIHARGKNVDKCIGLPQSQTIKKDYIIPKAISYFLFLLLLPYDALACFRFLILLVWHFLFVFICLSLLSRGESFHNPSKSHPTNRDPKHGVLNVKKMPPLLA